MYFGQMQVAYEEALEYHGSTMIEVTRRQHGRIIWRDWLIFDSVAEASEFYNARRQESRPPRQWTPRPSLTSFGVGTRPSA